MGFRQWPGAVLAGGNMNHTLNNHPGNPGFRLPTTPALAMVPSGPALHPEPVNAYGAAHHAFGGYIPTAMMLVPSGRNMMAVPQYVHYGMHRDPSEQNAPMANHVLQNAPMANVMVQPPQAGYQTAPPYGMQVLPSNQPST